MTLEDILDTINDNTVVEIFRADTAECIGTYDGKDSLSEEYNDCDITDIFTGMNGNTPTLCIESALETEEYESKSPCEYPDNDGHYNCPYSDDPTSEMCRCYCGCGVDE